MKQFFFSLTVIFFASTAHAQLNKGQWILGGSGSFLSTKSARNSSQSVDESKSARLQASVGVGYFILNKLVLGVRPGIGISHDQTKISTTAGNPFSYSDDGKTTITTIAPFARFYFLPVKNKLNLLADFSVSYEHNKTHRLTINNNTDVNGQPVVNSTTDDYKYGHHSFNFSAGPALFLNPKVSLELLAGYIFTKSKGLNTNQNSFSITAGFQIHLGK